LSRPEWTSLLPRGEVRVDSTWKPSEDVAAKLLRHFYPPTENTDLKKNRVEKLVIQARVESIERGIARARLDGRMRIKHPFYHQDDNNFVEADLVGYVGFKTSTREIKSLRLVTENGRYGGDVNGMQHFGAAARLASEPSTSDRHVGSASPASVPATAQWTSDTATIGGVRPIPTGYGYGDRDHRPGVGPGSSVIAAQAGGS
jgi:hypothetical protein